jgi:hypothetical protein
MQPRIAAETPIELLRRDAFLPHEGENFQVLRGDEWVTVKLESVFALDGHLDVEREKFSLLFTAGLDKTLQQGMHDFEHPVMGIFNLFFTPVISRDPAVRCYEAIINREF